MTIKIQKERGENMSETSENITKKQEEKRLEDFKKDCRELGQASGKSTRKDRWDYFDGCICIFERNKESR